LKQCYPPSRIQCSTAPVSDIIEVPVSVREIVDAGPYDSVNASAGAVNVPMFYHLVSIVPQGSRVFISSCSLGQDSETIGHGLLVDGA
jgi:hypothetical protein